MVTSRCALPLTECWLKNYWKRITISRDNNNAARKNEWSNETSGHETCLVILKQIHVRQKCYISTRYKRNRTLVDYEFMLIYILRFCGVSSSCFFGSGMEKYTTVFFLFFLWLTIFQIRWYLLLQIIKTLDVFFNFVYSPEWWWRWVELDVRARAIVVNAAIQ